MKIPLKNGKIRKNDYKQGVQITNNKLYSGKMLPKRQKTAKRERNIRYDSQKQNNFEDNTR